MVDDIHQNPGDGANRFLNPGDCVGSVDGDSSPCLQSGDSVRIAFSSHQRTEVGNLDAQFQLNWEQAPAGEMMLYSYGLHEDGSHMIFHRSHPCLDYSDCTEAAMKRFEGAGVTVYELIFPASSLGLDVLYAGHQFGLGIAVVDGDISPTDPHGQVGWGWSGWAPYAVGFGPSVEAANAGLATLSAPLDACGTLADGAVCDNGIPNANLDVCDEGVCRQVPPPPPTLAKWTPVEYPTMTTSSRYEVFLEPLPMAAAETECVHAGGHLASVHSAADNEAMLALIIGEVQQSQCENSCDDYCGCTVRASAHD